MEDLFYEQKNRLQYYAPYRFIREINADTHIQHFILPLYNNKQTLTAEIVVDDRKHLFVYRKLDWDTTFFAIPTYKLDFIAFTHTNTAILTKAIAVFIQDYFSAGDYLFCEIPSEDVLTLQALNKNTFAVIETRLTYFRNELASFNEPRYPARMANENDLNLLKKVAKLMRNNYDRFHADPIFTEEQGDAFLAAYFEASVKGFADAVLVPNAQDTLSASFLTAKYLKDDWEKAGSNISKMVLSAVSSEHNKGWYQKLISEMTYHLRDIGAEYIYMNTQSTNKAVIYIWEKLGYRFGASSHILSISKS